MRGARSAITITMRPRPRRGVMRPTQRRITTRTSTPTRPAQPITITAAARRRITRFILTTTMATPPRGMGGRSTAAPIITSGAAIVTTPIDRSARLGRRLRMSRWEHS